MTKYQVLLQVLKQLSQEAPAAFKSYHPSEDETELLNAARAKCFIHLLLKVYFGIIDFHERESYITEGSDDGGIDAFYIDQDRKLIYFIQSKFRQTEKNFEEKGISAEELLVMDINRLLEGEIVSESGVRYNSKILEMMRRIQKIGDIGRYAYRVVILANAKGVTRRKLQLLTGGFPVELIDFEICYAKLLFPLITGAYYTEEHLHLSLSLSDKNAGAKISYSVSTEATKCEITVVFVPTIEIARTMYKYRNAILQFNPRSYLSHEGKKVNAEIRKSIECMSTNEFALFNNGITILSDETSLNERIGQKDRAQLTLVNPQIINGGQTAYTLSVIYRENLTKSPEDLFSGKEVLVKIITFGPGNEISEDKKHSLIQAISRATNQQTAVTNADRRSNEAEFRRLQSEMFDVCGLLLERKRGEFEDGIREGYVDESQVVDRNLFVRAALAVQGRLNTAHKKRAAAEVNYQTLLKSSEIFERYAFAARLLPSLVTRRHKHARISREILTELWFATLLWFRPGLDHTAREALVTEIVPSVKARWVQFQKYLIEQQSSVVQLNKEGDPFVGSVSAYAQSGEAITDIAEFKQEMPPLNVKHTTTLEP